ncbi:pyruvate:ferredoxin (flavodoxin) oxidoreductase [Caloramator proteoclasticus]|uniref:Pyruvate:ferredoxin oxidoreductase n=1 Tax=Caloramator proteoclasticus DSM 10124 TaxID=1121262 RepID=A0A1M5BH95_9CLOT|nr:pyruvate:ferredoxin (flavodoxin) oxidoreductase [Caloramator proteoclasticus]SHF41582.1 pyruvate-ferredoxin/flavodoxin oxidoreductase [Caloramator proteoclasticus DSM 10124]
MARKMKTMDGNTAAAHVAYAFTEVAAIYPITPSSNMAEKVDEWSAAGRKNIFGQEVKVIEMQSEAGAAGAVHGSLQSGALTTTFTASQGLLLMIPNMYKIAGELLPGVFHVSARAIAAHALSIFGDHQDVMAARQTGFALLASASVQEAMDLGAVAHLSAIKSRVPFLHFFDGFRTSHEMQKIEILEYDELAKLVDYKALQEFRNRALKPESPVTRGTAQNPDIYFQGREAANRFYDAVPDIVESYMNEINKLTGRNYKPFNYYGAPDAERVIVAMGSVCETIETVVDYLNSKGEKVGLLKVRLFRPFSIKHFINEMPKSVKYIAVLDRTKEPGSLGEPLYEDVRAAYYDMKDRPVIVGGRYGLGSKDTTPGQIIAVFDNLKLNEPKNKFTIGIVDDVTYTSLPIADEVDVTPEGTVSCKFFGFGSDGTVGANKSSIKIIGDKTDLYAQAYFSYDSKKSGGVTVSHLRFGKKPIKLPYLIKKADFIACHHPSYVYKYDVLEGIKDGGIFLLNCMWSKEELSEKLPAEMKKTLAEKNINFYIINAFDLASKIGLGGRINMIMQTAFFKLANIIPFEDAVKYLKDAVVENYGLKGEEVVKMNHTAIDKAIESLVKVDIPSDWRNAEVNNDIDDNKPEFIKKILEPMNKLKGDELPVSAFVGIEDGTFPAGTTRYEKRGIAVKVPKWIPENCIQCNQCSFVCPHAVIRPFLLTDEEVKNAPEGFKYLKAGGGKNFEGYNFALQISVLDCTGCGNCVQVCPAKTKALEMELIETQMHEQKNYDYAFSLPMKPNPMNKETIKGSQFEQPLFEFHGACAGCGETPYIKVLTQLYGDRMIIANATGCSSIYGGSAPSTPYCKNEKGFGPAWANSLFEDNAEYGLGIHLGAKQIRERMVSKLQSIVEMIDDAAVKEAVINYINNNNDKKQSRAVAEAMVEKLKSYNATNENVKQVVEDVLMHKDYLSRKSTWIIGGDGWAYDIGFGGLDHVIASGEDVKILVLDTEVYSNTGGQSSKATPAAAIAQFAASGKKTKKKDLGMMAMSYGYVYVAQVAMGADKNQYLKALVEAENYDGPAVIIAYSPCINQGIKIGMGNTQEEAKRAVNAGYWHLYRYNPMLKEEGKNPFVLDSKEPTMPIKDFLMGEVRYAALSKVQPELAELMYKKAEDDLKERYEVYKKLAEQ